MVYSQSKVARLLSVVTATADRTLVLFLFATLLFKLSQQDGPHAKAS